METHTGGSFQTGMPADVCLIKGIWRPSWTITLSNSSISIIIREVIASRKNLAGLPVLENSALTHFLH